ncbi:ribonuclease H-like domain-containing protein, partial [Tanacetum coccineum]
MESKLRDDGDPVSDLTLYQSLAGSLQYLTFTRPDISYAVQQICLYMHDPREPHFSALKRILRCVLGTLDYGLQLFSSSTTSLVAYLDAEYRDVANVVAETFQHQRMKHIEIDIHFVKDDLVIVGQVRVLSCSISLSVIFIIKGLSALFEEFRA